tara:strand:+ start:6032 stop:7129 length:1098 start_codon:yes stop_codon:yes gene_type:complete
MNFIAKKDQIVEAIQNAAAVAERKNTIPILANMLITIVGKKAAFSATDLEIQIKTIAEVKEVKEEGEITVSAKKMSELCRSLPDNEEINFFLNLGKLSIRAKSFKADLSTISASDFPEIDCKEVLSATKVPPDLIRNILQKTHFSMASQDVRYYLNGLLIEVKEGVISAVATDGHRLAISRNNLKDVNDFSSIVPRKAVLELLKILQSANDEVELVLGSNFLSLNSDIFKFSSKLIDGKFPDYKKVFPEGAPESLRILRENLLSALSRASVLSNEKYRGVRLSLSENALKLSANNPEQESAEEDLEATYSGESFEIGFNIGYLVEALNSIDTKEAEISFYGEDSSCTINSTNEDDSLYVIMPMRL